MAVRTAYPGTQNVGDILTSANFTKLPGGWIGYAEVTANQTGITTITDLTSLSVAVTVGSSRRIKISAASRLTRTVADGYTTLYIREGSTKLSYGLILSTLDFSMAASVILTPTSGSHTYKLSLERTTGTGTTGIDAGTDHPTYILVEDIGPAS